MRIQAAGANAIHSSDVVKAQEYVKQVELLDKRFFEFGLSAEIYDSAMANIAKTAENYAKRLKTAADDERKRQAIMAEGRRVFEATRTPLEAFNAELENLKRLLDGGAISWDTYLRAMAASQFFGGRPILFGEEGPEIITPRASGTVIPNHELGERVVNNTRVVNNFTITGPVTRTTEDQIAAAALRSVRRGGRNV